MATKTCSTCKRERSPEMYYRNVRTYDGLQTSCKDCQRTYRREWGRANPDAVRRWSRKQHPKRYGMTLGEYEAYLASGCQVCGATERLHLDHCHASGVIRGALCHHCNTALGLVGESPDRLRALIEYLERGRGR